MAGNRVEGIAAGQVSSDSLRGERIVGISIEWNSSTHPAKNRVTNTKVVYFRPGNIIAFNYFNREINDSRIYQRYTRSKG